MLGKAMIAAVFVLLLTATLSWAQGVGYGGVPVSMVMPGQPTHVTATAGNKQATIRFMPPKSTGGSAITRYTVTSHPGLVKASGKQSPITVRGLSNGRSYTFTVTATNSFGTGPASKTCNSVIPKAE